VSTSPGRLARSTALTGEAAPRAILALAVAIAALTRLGWLGLVEFQNDESWALRVAADIARGRSFPLVGIGSSLDVPNAPFFVYLMALPQIVSRDPSVATALIGLLGVGAVVATYGLARTLCRDRIAGATAALLYAISPWGIIFSRKIWEQDALPFFVTLGFWALFASLLSGKRHLFAPGLLLLGLATQLHPTAFLLAVPALVLVGGCVALDRPRIAPALAWSALGLWLALAAEAPFLAWQGQNGWPLPRAIVQLVRSPGHLDLDAVRLAGSAIAGNAYPTLADVADGWRLASYVEVLLLGAGVFLLAARVRAPRPPAERVASLALLVWLAAPVLFQLRHSLLLFPHYFIVVYPAPFLVMGMTVAMLWRRAAAVPSGPPALAAGGLLVVSLAIPAWLGLAAFGDYALAVQRGAVWPTSGVPLDRQKALFAAIDGLANGGPVFLGSHDSLAPTMAYFSDDGWYVFDDRTGLAFPSDSRSAVLAITDPSSPAGRLADRWFGPQRLTTLDPTTWSHVAVYRADAGGAEAAPGYHAMEVPFDDGLVLTGYRVIADRATRRLLIGLHWRADRPPAVKPPTVFNHLLDPRGETVGQIDGLAYERLDWQAGEVRIDEFAMAWPLAAGPYRLEVGLYDYPSMRRYQVVAPGSGAARDAVELGTLRLDDVDS
jgi:4-amino-4-deoxy-L-arabinose transferase-like glycosyltransferase